MIIVVVSRVRPYYARPAMLWRLSLNFNILKNVFVAFSLFSIIFLTFSSLSCLTPLTSVHLPLFGPFRTRFLETTYHSNAYFNIILNAEGEMCFLTCRFMSRSTTRMMIYFRRERKRGRNIIRGRWMSTLEKCLGVDWNFWRQTESWGEGFGPS